MPTQKERINLTVPSALRRSLGSLAKREEQPVASVVLQLITRALENEEDIVLQAVAEKREKKKGALVSHARAWK